MNGRWSKAEEIGDTVLKLAGKHGLALYDPQGPDIFYFDEAGKKPWWKFW
jgi:hypothetical protein